MIIPLSVLFCSFNNKPPSNSLKIKGVNLTKIKKQRSYPRYVSFLNAYVTPNIKTCEPTNIPTGCPGWEAARGLILQEFFKNHIWSKDKQNTKNRTQKSRLLQKACNRQSC